jgi:hypothetical protein
MAVDRAEEMMRSLSNLALRATLVCCVLWTSPAHAGSADVVSLRNQLEDQWLDGDKDSEDLAVLRLGREPSAGSRLPTAYLALEGFAGRHASGQREVAGRLVVQFPFERLWMRSPVRPIDPPRDVVASAFRPAWPSAPSRVVAAGSAAVAADTSSEAKPSAESQPPSAHGSEGHPASVHGSEGSRAALVVVDMALARACVGAALRALGLADDARLDGLAARARSSALLPELRIRAMRSIDETGRVTLSDVDPLRYTETGGATDWIEARVTFRLDRLLFADDEVAIERIRVERFELRSRVVARTIESLFEWQRAYALAREPGLGSDEHFAALVRELETAARLDVLTDGWFGRFRAGLKGPASP